MIFHGSRFHPICKKSFDANKFGITNFCKALGYQSGIITKKDVLLHSEAFMVGTCVDNDDNLLGCTGGGNTQEIGGGECGKGSYSGMTVLCIGGLGKSHSCKSRFNFYN